jgi:molybdopterin-binding protein
LNAATHDATDRVAAGEAPEHAARRTEERHLKISAETVIKGKVVSIKLGVVNGEVVVEGADGIDLVANSTLRAMDELGLAEGQEAFAVLKAATTMVAASHHKRGERPAGHCTLHWRCCCC